MDIDILLTAAQHYYADRYSFLFNQLRKYSNQLEITDHQDYLPFLILNKNDIYLWIKELGVSDFPFLFTDPDEIAFVLHSFFSSGDTLYISKEFDLSLSKRQIEEEIEKCLLSDNHEGFKTWTALYKNLH